MTPMEVSLTDGKVEDVLRQIQKDEDVYVTMHGSVQRRNEKLKSCGVTDGCTIQVTSRMREGGRHKNKKSKVEKKQVTIQEPVKNESPAILESDKQSNQVRFGQEDQLKEARAESTDEPEVTGRLAEVRTGRGSSGLVRGEMRGNGRTRSAGKAKDRVIGEKAATEAKEELEAKEDSSSRTR